MTVIEIDDPDDPRVRDYLHLTDVALRSRSEPEQGLYLAESIEVIGRAVQAGHRPRSYLMSHKWLGSLDDALRRTDAGPHGPIPVYLGPEALLRQITGFHLHRGAIAAMHRPGLPSVAEVLRGARTIAICEDIVDHTNVGAIFRSAAGLGADAVLVTPRCADPLYRRSVRVSMGAVYSVPWTRLASWPGDLVTLRSRGFAIIGLDPDPDAMPLQEFCANRPERLALVLGTEGPGLSAQARDELDARVRIPMSSQVDSLNVAAASAVAFWALRAALVAPAGPAASDPG